MSWFLNSPRSELSILRKSALLGTVVVRADPLCSKYLLFTRFVAVPLLARLLGAVSIGSPYETISVNTYYFKIPQSFSHVFLLSTIHTFPIHFALRRPQYLATHPVDRTWFICPLYFRHSICRSCCYRNYKKRFISSVAYLLFLPRLESLIFGLEPLSIWRICSR